MRLIPSYLMPCSVVPPQCSRSTVKYASIPILNYVFKYSCTYFYVIVIIDHKYRFVCVRLRLMSYRPSHTVFHKFHIYLCLHKTYTPASSICTVSDHEKRAGTEISLDFETRDRNFI